MLATRWSTALLALLVFLPRSARAQASDPGEHYQRGVAEAKAGHFEAARSEFEAALRLRPHPLVLYNLAKISLELGDKPSAIGYLKRYLAMDMAELPAEQVAEVRAMLLLLETQERPSDAAASAGVAPPSGATPSPSESAPMSKPKPPAAEAATATPKSATDQPPGAPINPTQSARPPRPVTAPLALPPPPALEPTAWGEWALAGTGLALVLGGVGVFMWNDYHSDAIDAERAELMRDPPRSPEGYDEVKPALNYARSLGQIDARYDEVRHFDVVAWSLTVAGVACLGTGAWLLWSGEREPAKTVALLPDGVRVRW